MINNTEKNLAQGQEGSQKIPSLFELNIANRDEKEEGKFLFSRFKRRVFILVSKKFIWQYF